MRIGLKLFKNKHPLQDLRIVSVFNLNNLLHNRIKLRFRHTILFGCFVFLIELCDCKHIELSSPANRRRNKIASISQLTDCIFYKLLSLFKISLKAVQNRCFALKVSCYLSFIDSFFFADSTTRTNYRYNNVVTQACTLINIILK